MKLMPEDTPQTPTIADPMAPSTPPQTEPSNENTSGKGSGFVVPEEIKGWSWGAFLLSWIWGIGNSVWLALLCFVPVVSLVMPFVLGFEGRKWAWQAKRWDSIEHFKKTQRNWDIAAVIIFVSLFVLGLVLGVIVGINSASQAGGPQL
jgi:hypothetical protein